MILKIGKMEQSTLQYLRVLYTFCAIFQQTDVHKNNAAQVNVRKRGFLNKNWFDMIGVC